jgi:hypothetical protein
MATPTTLPASFSSGAVLTAAQMNNLRGAFRVLQVVSTVKTDTFTSTSTSYTDITGLSATITPSATSSKILIMAQVTGSISNANSDAYFVRLAGGNSGNFVGDAASLRTRAASASLYAAPAAAWLPYYTLQNQIITYLDSPSTTSATTYKVQIVVPGGTAYINRTGFDADNAYNGRAASSITVMEISA